MSEGKRRVVPCPACGLTVVLEPATNTVRHENPVCAEFTRRMVASGLQATRAPWTVVVNPLTGEVKEPAKA